MTTKETIKQVEKTNELIYTTKETQIFKKALAVWVEIDNFPYKISNLKEFKNLLKNQCLEEHIKKVLSMNFKQGEEIELITTFFDNYTTKSKIKMEIL